MGGEELAKQEELIAFRVSAEERRLIEKVAKREKMEVSDYVRSCVYLDLLFSGDAEAMKLMAARIREKVARRLKRMMGAVWKAEEQM